MCGAAAATYSLGCFVAYGVEGRWGWYGALRMCPERLDTEICAGSRAEERRSLSAMMPSSHYWRHCDADGHHTTIDTASWVLSDTTTLCVLGLAGGGPVVTASSDVRVILG